MNGFRRYLGGGRYQTPASTYAVCPDGIRPMFEFLPCGDEPRADPMTTDRDDP